MTPEQDPAICLKIDNAVEQIAKLSRHSAVEHRQTWYHDPGQVPARIAARLAGLAARYGFTMVRTDDLPYGCMGATGGDTPHLPPEERLRIQIAKGMSPASEARVMAHEAAHVVLGHAGLTREQAYQKTAARMRKAKLGLGHEDPQEEAAAELAAGAFCKVAGIGTGKFSRSFIYSKLHGKPVTPETLAAAKLAARILYAAARPALTERNAA